ncbi:PepSY domain-containing protein [Methylophaga sp. OBS3]|uniref:PepSY domain-containing protein n=1 Tax=Methylophaga sp. OBS3 TaxID=2991934 RepID=UPI002259CF47|nr:PepSY domain-containing protein [Methylophaga sp. OBS3]MCX4189668.1 PepSY domain-containing protein [Methylophaga sp. OBS3]
MKTLISAGVLSLTLLSGSAIADDAWEIQHKAEQLGLISLEKAQKVALEAKPGLIDDIDLENREFLGGWDYEFEILGRDGKEWEVKVNAETGEIRDISRDWDWF